MIEIRPAREEDRNLLKTMYLSEVENHDDRAVAFAERLIGHFNTLLALHDNKLCGTLTWDTRGGYDDGVVELVALGVNNEFRRQRIATKLVERMIEDAALFYSERDYTLRVIILFMEGGNKNARKFYSQIGFLEVARIPNLYPHDDGVIWARYL
ncbi:MAG: GNAT family N-acetyltransferase [Candidatus Odinarchaeota archaeon]